MNWIDTLQDVGAGVVVNKGISVKYDGIKLPRFVSEYLLSEFMLKYPDQQRAAKEMSIFIDAYIPQPGHVSEWQYRLKRGDSCQVIDNLRVTVHLEKRDQEPQVQIPSIGLSRARIQPRLLIEHPRLLRAGLWGKVTLRANDSEVWVEDFAPFQISDVSLDHYKEIRGHFSLDEWSDILISTIGLSPSVVTSPEQRLTIIARLLPLVQGQTFLIEMGPPGTGKTFVLDKLSTRSVVISGSKVSPATMFYNVQSKKEGLLRHFSAILLDEIDKVRDSEFSEEVTNKMLKYMESGTFDRGGIELNSTASIIMAGNMSVGGRHSGPLLRNLPRKLVHGAFLDRLNGILPGWVLSPIGQSDESLTRTWGFSADYFSEIMEVLRQSDWVPILSQRIKFDGCTIRDEKAIMRTTAGLTKLLHPDLNVSNVDLDRILKYAVSLRQNVLDEITLLHQQHPRHISAFVI